MKPKSDLSKYETILEVKTGTFGQIAEYVFHKKLGIRDWVFFLLCTNLVFLVSTIVYMLLWGFK